MSVVLISSRLTERDSTYGTCADTHAELRIYPASEMPAEDVTTMLGVEPSHMQNEGWPIKNSRGRVRKVPRTGWFLSSEKHVKSRDLRDHLDWLIQQLTGAESKLLELQRMSDVKMTIACIWWSSAGHGGPVLWPEQMEALAKLNLECSFDVYFCGEE